MVVVGLTTMNKTRISRKIEPTSVLYQEPTTAPQGVLLLSIPKFLIFFINFNKFFSEDNEEPKCGYLRPLMVVVIDNRAIK